MEFKNNLKVLALAGAVTVSSIFGMGETSFAKSFSDLTNSGSHAEAVQYLNSVDAYEYKSGNKFNGNSQVTRAEVAQLLHTMFADDLEVTRQYNNGKFKDVTSATGGSDAIIWSYEVGIFDGGTDGKFGPTSKLTRAQMAKILVNAFDLKANTKFNFKDVPANHWANEFISVLATNGVTLGDGKGSYLPNNNVTLDQLSSFVYRIMKNSGEVNQVVTQTPQVTTPQVTAPQAQSGAIEELKAAAIKLYNSSEYQPADVVIYTKDNYRTELKDWTFFKVDISEEISGYTRYGRNVSISVEETEKGFKNTITIYNDRDEADEVKWKQKMDSAKKHIEANYTLNTDYDVVVAINDFLVNNMEYGELIDSSHPYLEQRANATTCTGYTDVTAELLERFGIKHRYVESNTHAWNLVFVGGEWYHMDTTFNDNGYDEQKFLLMTQSERLESVTNITVGVKATDVPFSPSMAKPI